ncbi:MAG: helix-turn-helix domain-containing protein, partial [Myxococcota bacterium]
PQIDATSLTFSTIAADPSMVTFDSGSAERKTIQDALAQARGNRAQAARILGIPRSSLLYRMKKWSIN